jgi:hypothetical protein
MTFYETITAAVNDMARSGYDSQKRLDGWVAKIRQAATSSMVTKAMLDRTLRATLSTIYKRMVTRGGLFKYHPGVSKFTVERLTPKMRSELDRRVAASANLITLNREKSIQSTLQRFSGWASSIPAGGTTQANKPEVKETVQKSLKALPFEERRVLIDQGHKFTSAINDIVATEGGAIAMVWNSNWRQSGYNYREDHKDRDKQVYLFKSSWARDKGLVKPGPAGLLEDITKPAEEPFCRCYGTYIYSIGKLPEEMLTKKGKDELAAVREKLKDL